ncbi:MAG: DUF4423 domain-containing protein [Myxococcales bacterium]|nr:DUF4423 domain-containing protein [Myxococcales bacterium]
MNYDDAAKQLLRALRGSRSQRAFSRRLGFTGNPVASWEAGRRFPTADGTFAAARVAGIDVAAAVRSFHAEAAEAFGVGDTAGVARWLDALRGQLSRAEVARRADLSRFAVTRWMNGVTRPRLPAFLTLVDALTGRLADLVSALVPIEQVPALRDQHARVHASRRLAFEQPWTEAVVRILECNPGVRADRVATCLGISEDEAQDCLQALLAAGVVARRRGTFRARGVLTVDTRDAPTAMRDLKSHWASLGVRRARTPRPGDLVSYNVMSVSRRDLERIRQLHIDYFRAVRAVVAESTPEVAAMINVQLLGLHDDPPIT